MSVSVNTSVSGGSGPGATADTLIAAAGVSAGTFNTPLLPSPLAVMPPPTFWPKKRYLGSFTTTAAALSSLSGGATLSSTDTTDPYWANSALTAYPGNLGTSPVVTLPSAGAATVIPSNTALTAVDLTGMNVYVVFKVIAGGAIGPGSLTAGIRLYNGASPSAAGANYKASTRTDFNPSLEWQVLGMAIEDFADVGTGADITQITHCGIRLGGTTVSTQVELGGFFACPKQLSKAAVIIGFDDCRQDTWTDAFPEMHKRGFPGVLYPGAAASVMRATDDQFQMNPNELFKLNRIHGWQVASQAYSTENPAFSGDQATSEMASLRALWEGIKVSGGYDGSYFSNLGPHVTGWKDAFKTNFRTMRGYNIASSGAITAKQATPETFPIADPNYVKALGVDLNAHALADLTNYVSYAAATKGVAILIFHGVAASNGTQYAKFTGLLDYLDANRATIEVCTFDRVIQYGYAYPL
jgi:hypothetical protein